MYDLNKIKIPDEIKKLIKTESKLQRHWLHWASCCDQIYSNQNKISGSICPLMQKCHPLFLHELPELLDSLLLYFRGVKPSL